MPSPRCAWWGRGRRTLRRFRPARAGNTASPSPRGTRRAWAATTRCGGTRLTYTIEGFNDAFEEARSLGDEASSEHVVDVDSASTVEPGEPADTGVRTKWWEWQAPEDGGLHTWRLQDAGEIVPSYPKMRVTLWTGTAVDDLVPAAEIGPGAPFETLLDAVGGEQYWIAAGLRNGDAAAYEQIRGLREVDLGRDAGQRRSVRRGNGIGRIGVDLGVDGVGDRRQG